MRTLIRNAKYVDFSGQEKLERKQLEKIKLDSRRWTWAIIGENSWGWQRMMRIEDVKASAKIELKKTRVDVDIIVSKTKTDYDEERGFSVSFYP